MKNIRNILFLLVFTVVSTQIKSQNFNQIIKAVASDRATSDLFGRSVAIDGDYAVVGAYIEDEDASGINTLTSAGSVYIFKRDATSGDWTQIQKIVASDRATSDYFGYSVAISGNYVVVGAYQEDEDASGINTLTSAGSVYIFKNNGSDTYNEVAKIVASDRAVSDNFGYKVAIDGNYVVVGAHQEDEDASGINTLTSAGSAYMFKNDGADNFNQVAKIVASDRAASDYFGRSVAISGSYVAVGAYQEDEDAGGVNTLTGAGSAYIFKNDGADNFNQVDKIVASDRATSDYFGYSVAIDGNYVVVSSHLEDEDAVGANTMSSAGSAYIFKNDGADNFNQIQKIVASDRTASDYFAYNVDIDGLYIVVAGRFDDEDATGENTATTSGSAYIFKNDGADSFSEVQKIVASDRSTSDYFGSYLAISGNYVIVGADSEDEDASGQNTLTSAGSAYIFSPDGIIYSSNRGCAGNNNASVDITGFSAGTSPYSYSWSNGQTGPSATALTTGTYVLTVTDANTVDFIYPFTTYEAAALTVTTMLVNSCYGLSDGSIDVTTSGATTPYSYSWSNSATTEDISGLSANTYAFTVTAGVCSSISSYTVTEPSVPIVNTKPITITTSTEAQSGGDVTCEGISSVTDKGVCWSTTGNPTIGNYSTNEGSGPVGYISFIDELSPGTTYYVRAYATNSAGTSYGNEETFVSGGAPSGYCVPSTGSWHMTDVDLDGENGNNIHNNGTSCEGYSDNTNMVAELYTGSSYNISVTVDKCGGPYTSGGIEVYIDWNRDGDFDDASEDIGNVSASVSGTGVMAINVPIGALYGNTRMRIGVTGSGYTENPCSMEEAEDYTINVLPQQYCSVNGTSSTNGYIKNVSIEAINRSGLFDGYKHTYKSATILTGDSYNISIT